MSTDHYMRKTGLEHSRPRSAPQCYSRQAGSKAISESRVDAQSNDFLLLLSNVTCIAAFLIAYNGWSF
jgi:hypothetical protein